MSRPSVLLLSFACAWLAGCGRNVDRGPAAEGSSSSSTARASWSEVRDALVDDYLKAHPVFAVVAGRHEYDGMLPDWSSAGIGAEIRRLRDARGRVLTFPDSALDERGRFERDLFVARMDRDLFWLETAEAPFANPAFYLDWMLDNLDPAPYLTRNYAPLETRLRGYLKYAHAIPQATSQIRANLRIPLSLPLLERGVSASRGFAAFFDKDVAGIFSSVADAALLADLEKGNAAASRAMKDLLAWLESQRPTATASFALGADKFARMLYDTERVTTSLADLEAAGRADLARNQAALREACSKFAPGAGISECIGRMARNKPRGGSVQGARSQLASLKAFVQSAGVASIPGAEEALVNEAPPYNRDNFAYIDIPGPYEKGLPATYYIAPPDPSWTPKEQQEYLPGQADLLFTSVHEVWPGHFLHFLHSNRSESLVSRLFVGYAFAEGWAHYAEEMMWETGVGAGDPELHVGQLANALLRNVRFLSAIGLHTRGMTVAESERMFREQAYTDAGTARQQATRGTYDPAYLNYTMGKLMIRKLREDWTASRGQKAAWRDFHDRFLGFGGPPIPMVRQAMLGPAPGSLF
jgi:uncharacterized protein (DUF885 family)